MSFLSALGKLGSIALDFIPGGAAAKTGVKIAKGIAKGAAATGDIGSVLGKQQEGAAKGKVDQATLNQGQDRNAISLYQAQQAAENQAAQTDLQRQQFGTQNRSSTAKQALIGALLGGGVTPTSFSGGQASGGLMRSLNGNPDALAAMKTLGSQGSQAQNTPLLFSGGEMVKPPAMTAMPQVDQGGIMSTLAKLGELAGTASPYLNYLKKPSGNGVTDSSGNYIGE